MPEFTSAASNETVRLRFPSSWRPVDEPRAIPGLPIANPVATSPGAASVAGLIAGTVPAAGVNGARGADLLPAGFAREANVRTVRREAVRLGSTQAYRYRGLTVPESSSRLTLYVVPTTAGVATIGCYSARGAPASFPQDCEQAATTLTLVRGRAYPITPDEDYAQALNTAFSMLTRARRNPSATLRSARTASGQARAASRLASAYQTTARPLGRRAVSPAILEEHGALVGALRGIRDGFARLASSARRNNPSEYRRARRSVVRREAGLRRALGALSRAGYSVR